MSLRGAISFVFASVRERLECLSRTWKEINEPAGLLLHADFYATLLIVSLVFWELTVSRDRQLYTELPCEGRIRTPGNLIVYR